MRRAPHVPWVAADNMALLNACLNGASYEELSARFPGRTMIALRRRVKDFRRRGYEFEMRRAAPSMIAPEPTWDEAAAQMDGQHVAEVLARGGFPTFTEKRGPKGRCVVCLPLIWPGA